MRCMYYAATYSLYIRNRKTLFLIFLKNAREEKGTHNATRQIFIYVIWVHACTVQDTLYKHALWTEGLKYFMHQSESKTAKSRCHPSEEQHHQGDPAVWMESILNTHVLNWCLAVHWSECYSETCHHQSKPALLHPTVPHSPPAGVYHCLLT